MARAWSVPLPEGAEPPYEVYVNGERRVEGRDFTAEGRWLRFTTPLRRRPPLGLGRRIMLMIGIGVYGDLKGDTIDLRFMRDGRSELASDLPVIPPQEPPAG